MKAIDTSFESQISLLTVTYRYNDGHYVAARKFEGRWYRIDDREVELISEYDDLVRSLSNCHQTRALCQRQSRHAAESLGQWRIQRPYHTVVRKDEDGTATEARRATAMDIDILSVFGEKGEAENDLKEDGTATEAQRATAMNIDVTQSLGQRERLRMI